MATSAELTEMIAFDDFARLIHAPEDGDWRPYPWQRRFAERCASPSEAHPSWIVAPTGAGKTMVVDALVWALAKQADIPAVERTASTRIVWAIDRRILVDEVYKHACDLARRLEAALDGAPGDDPLREMATRLLSLATAGEDVRDLCREEREARDLRPLAVTRWRGGLPRAHTLLAPFQPQIITSTVGQIGSRLLFRGYGVGQSSLPLSAGLAASDTTICLDEAHLAMPFRETINAIRRHQRKDGPRLHIPGFHLLTLTATPPPDYDRGDAVHLEEADHERLGGRWTGDKSLELREAGGNPEQELAVATEELVEEGRRIVACVVNRVLTARKVHERIAKSLGDRTDVLLLMGPQRPADRAAQLKPAARAALFEGKTPERPLVVVATQTIEVGLDADFDGMVTQSASASALTQRLGRLNRSGTRPGKCIVTRDEGSFLYESDEPAAWHWLQERPGAPDEIDVSVQALAEDQQRPADRRPPTAATLTDSIVRQLTQTSPRPAPLAEPDIDQLLTGIGSRSARDVQIVWRCDLRTEDDIPDGHAYRETLLKLVRPQPDEALTLSEQAAKSLIRTRSVGAAQLNDADVEGGGREKEADWASGDHTPFVVVRGREILQGVSRASESDDTFTLSEIRAGDTIVVPTRLGGADKFGLNPQHPGPTNDVFPDLIDTTPNEEGTPPSPIRLSRETLEVRLGCPAPDNDGEEAKQERARIIKRWRRIADRLSASDHSDGRTLSPAEVADLLDTSNELSALPAVSSNVASAPADRLWRVRRVDPPPPADTDPLAPPEDEREQTSDPDQERDDTASGGGPQRMQALDRAAWVLVPVTRVSEGKDETSAREAPPTLESHSEAVRQRVSRYASWLDLPEPERLALELAALAHDLGKVDPRFQDYLAGDVRSPGSKPLAKSTFGTGDPAADRLARKRSGLPARFRHEARSVAILRDALEKGGFPANLSVADGPLTLFLTGVHHGRGRPLWPLDTGGRPGESFAVDLLGVRGSSRGDNADAWLRGGWFQLFFDLQDRYGPWTLAYLEALFALADRTVSREGG